MQHSHLYRGGRGVARFSILTSIVVAQEWPDSAFSLLSWRPRSGPMQHSHFYRGGRGVARFSIPTSIVVAAEWPDSAFSLLSWWSRSGPIQHSRFYRGGPQEPNHARIHVSSVVVGMLHMMMVMMMMMITAAIMCFYTVAQCVCVCRVATPA
jgi:hypothetical protein